jgi:lysophospholipase L1-like esterase
MKFIYHALIVVVLSFQLVSFQAMSQTVPKGTTTSMPAPRLHLVGDSTMADKVNLAYPERGWGQLLPEFMLQQLSIINHAANGRSTLRFLNEGRWQLLLTELKAGDYVLIQFGHNDQKKDDPSRYAAADTTFPMLLSRFIAEIRAKEAIPMLATPICRRSFNAQGQLENNLNEYADATRNVASREKVTLFDLNAQSCADLSRFGLAASQAYFIQVPAGLYQQFPDGKIDNTHLNTQGASWIAQLFVRELKKQQHPLAALVWRELL